MSYDEPGDREAPYVAGVGRGPDFMATAAPKVSGTDFTGGSSTLGVNRGNGFFPPAGVARLERSRSIPSTDTFGWSLDAPPLRDASTPAGSDTVAECRLCLGLDRRSMRRQRLALLATGHQSLGELPRMRQPHQRCAIHICASRERPRFRGSPILRRDRTAKHPGQLGFGNPRSVVIDRRLERRTQRRQLSAGTGRGRRSEPTAT